MKEMKRYLTSHGTMCNGADVAELEGVHAELLEAAIRVVEWWDSDAGVSPSAYGLIDQMRDAIAKAQERRAYGLIDQMRDAIAKAQERRYE